MSDNEKFKPSCLNCIEWEYFEGIGHGCFCMQTTLPIDAEKCEFYCNKYTDFRKILEGGAE